MKRILVGVDGSVESTNAARFAAGLAASMGARLSLACVISPVEVPLAPEQLAAQRAHLLERQRQDARRDLRKAADACAQPNLRVDTEVFEGVPSVTLADAALAPDVGLLVVGHRGRNAVARLLLGSVADALVQISPKPVLVFREG